MWRPSVIGVLLALNIYLIATGKLRRALQGASVPSGGS